jgi:hypothetical protein
MNVTAHEGFDFPRWMHDLDNESRARLDRFLELAAEAAQKRAVDPLQRSDQ